MKVTILGSGSSTGVPAVGLGWGKCDSTEEKNRRTRSSILIELKDLTLLVDTSPDLREQLLASDICSLDAVLYTHAHADHLNGIDDLRGINRAMNAPINIFAMPVTLKEIRKRFSYTLQPLQTPARGFSKPALVPNEVIAGDILYINNVPVQTFEQDHGFSKTLGLRIQGFAYSTDVVNFSEENFEILRGIDTWVIGVFSNKEHPTHVHVKKALEWIDRVKPKRAFFTHLSSDLDFNELRKCLPLHVFPAFDGLQIDL